MSIPSPRIRYIKKNIDSLSIVTLLAQFTWQDSPQQITESTHVVLAALRKTNPYLETATIEELQNYLKCFNEQQIIGLVSNLKAIMHNIQLIRLENQQGDAIYACYVDQKATADFEVLLCDVETGESWRLQLEMPNYAKTRKPWQTKQPEDALLATSELTDAFSREHSASQHSQLTQHIESAIDFMVSIKDPQDEHFWDYFPFISIVSVSIAIYELFKRYQQQEISWSEFKWMSAKISGLKVSKIAFIGLLLGLPIAGQVTGAYLIANLLINAKHTWFDTKNPNYKKIIK